MMEEKVQNPGGSDKNTKPKEKVTFLGTFYDVVEMLASVAAVVMLVFAFVIRLNIVDGESMEHTLHDGQYLLVSDLFYEPTRGDIVIVHDISATPYNKPLVKRVIATEGQTVDIDFSTWTLTVDSEVVTKDADYRWIDPDSMTLTSAYPFPITVPEGEIFVLGDNRNHSADSRQAEIGTIDKRCVVGKAIARFFPLDTAEIFKNPYDAD